MSKYNFRDEGKDYPMVLQTEYWKIGAKAADDFGHKNYSDFFDRILKGLNLPYDYTILIILPETIDEIRKAHAIKGDYSERHKELVEIERRVEKVMVDFEATHIIEGFFGANGNEYKRDTKAAVEGFSGNPNRQELLKHGVDITEMVKSGAADDCIGREEEIWATMLTLARRKKSNPVLVGPAGVGKSQIVYGLAHRIARKEAGFLNDWTIIEMSTTGLVAGTKYVGELEKKMNAIIEAVKKVPNLILFIDEIHTIMGTGKGEKSTLDIANILKPVLATGDLKLIGATTEDEYHILEKDPAVERRFNKISVKEPSFDESIEILMGIKKTYEKFHGVTFYKKGIEIMPNIAKRYNPKRNLPDSAVDILDYCGALARMSDVRKITPKVVKEFARKLYNIDDKEEVDVRPLTDREINKRIGFI